MKRDLVAQLLKAIERLEAGYQSCSLTASWCADRIVWLYRYKHITRKQMEELCDRVAKLFEMGIE